MKIQIVDMFQNWFLWLTNWKERVLKRFFALPWVEPIFRYITPNDLCYLRILAAIVILFLYMRGYYGWLFPIFVTAVLFDFIDGPLARATNRVSEDGKNLDPIADKVLISIPLLVIGIDHFAPQAIMMYMLVEGLLVLTANYLKPYLREKFSIPLTSGANAFGQIKMTVQAIAVGILLFNPSNPVLLGIGEVLIWIGIAFGIASFLRHLARMDKPVEPHKRIITIPNLITFSGIFLFIPAGVALSKQQWWLAGIIIAWIFTSDWLDGWIARRFNQETAFGAVLDPLRDYIARFMVITWFFFQMEDWLARIVVVAIVIVEIFCGLVNVSTAKHCHIVQLVNQMGKIRALIHYLLLGVIFFHVVGAYQLHDKVVIVVFFCMFIFSLMTLSSYVDQRRRLITEYETESQVKTKNRRK